MDALIEDLLVYNRLSQTPVSLAPLSLAAVFSDVQRAYAYVIRALEATVESDVPPVQIVADEAMLYLILSHFLSNALKFVAPGVAPQVRIRVESRDERIRILFEDNGIGIAEEYADRIFGVFQRLNKAEAYPGTGMGLAIARRAAERINARIGVESEPGKGSLFWLEILTAT
jgi:signal transduction histidine kinase